MYVFVSWAFVDLAEHADDQRNFWVDGLSGKTKADKALAEKLTTEFCLPEYFHLQKAIAANDDLAEGLPLDDLNSQLLGVKFFSPGQNKSVKYQLHRRLPPEVTQPVSLASRSFLLKNCPGEWSATHTKGAVTLVGFEGLKDFLRHLAFSCAAIGAPLPPSLWNSAKIIELPGSECRDLVESLAKNAKDAKQREVWQEAILGWFSPGASAIKDAEVLRLAAASLGMLVQKDKENG